MKLYTNKNISTREYQIIGFEYANEVNFKITIAELLSNNTDTDTELLYTLQDDYIDKIIDLQIAETMFAKSTRDNNENNDIIIKRIS